MRTCPVCERPIPGCLGHTPGQAVKIFVEQRKALRVRVAELEAWQLAIAEGTGFVNFAEGQSGYEVADPKTILDYLEQEKHERFALERSVRRNTREASGEPKGGLKSLGSAEQTVPSGAVPIEPSPLCHGIGLKSSATRQGGREPETRADAKAGSSLEGKP